MKMVIDNKGGNTRQSKINDGKLLINNQLITDNSYNPNMVFWPFGHDVDDFSSVHI